MVHIYVFVYVLIECASKMVNHGFKLPFNQAHFQLACSLSDRHCPLAYVRFTADLRTYRLSYVSSIKFS